MADIGWLKGLKQSATWTPLPSACGDQRQKRALAVNVLLAVRNTAGLQTRVADWCA
jgi:hypothetical protein